MRFVVKFLQRSTVGIMLFSAKDMNAAEVFVDELVTLHGHTAVSDPAPFTGNVYDLYHMFPPRERLEDTFISRAIPPKTIDKES